MSLFGRDTIVVGGGHTTHTHNTRVDVHEHRAPTDASVKLFDELREVALKNIVEQYKLPVLGAECVIVVFRDPSVCGLKGVARIVLPRREIIVDAVVDGISATLEGKDAVTLLGRELHKKLAEVIAAEMLEAALARADVHTQRTLREA